MKVIVLGAGLVGGPMALDLASGPDIRVTVADHSQDALEALTGKARRAGVPVIVTRDDLEIPANVAARVQDFDLVINAMPGFLGFQTLKAVVEAGKNVVDIAFFIEDPFALDELAKSRNVTALVDMGVAPGMCNVLIGYAAHLLDRLERVTYMVGGLPEVRTWPWEYRAVFSPADVIEEYSRPARLKERGEVIVKPALSDPELIDFPGVGTLEAFNTDGLRSLLHTVACPDMKEKTLRWPGHIEKIRILRESGFLGTEPVELNGHPVRPVDLTSQLLFHQWKLQEGEADLTVMRVVAEGLKNGDRLRLAWDLDDRYDPVSGIHSMARTTGYTATVALRMIASGLYTHKGISVPEYVGKHPSCVKFLLDGLAERGVVYRFSKEPVE